MLIGYYEAKISKKHQVSFPTKFRNELGKKVVITKGIEENLLVVSIAHLQSLLEGTKDKPFLNKNVRNIQRYLLGNAFEVELDLKGRMVIPRSLVEYAKLRDNMYFVGVNHFVEIWSKQNWEKTQKSYEKEIGSIADILGSEDRNDK